MKRILLLSTLLIILSITLYAQQDVTQFLGIPVDGSKSVMIRKLRAKGYMVNPYNKDILTGEFNGENVNIHIVTNKNKVWRIMVVDNTLRDGEEIKLRFDRLCQQFKENKKYLEVTPNCFIPDEENIPYEMSVHKKQYGAIFYQKPVAIDSATISKRLAFLSGDMEEQWENPPVDVSEVDTSIINISAIDEFIKSHIKQYVLETLISKPVWFMIQKYEEKYAIAIYYDNEHNKANGEDL